MRARILLLSLTLGVMLSLVVGGCSDDSTDPGPVVVPEDFGGIWDLDAEVIAKRLCGGQVGETQSYQVGIIQNGGSATLVVDGLIPVPLSISGSHATGTYSGEFDLEVDMAIEEGALNGTWMLTQTDCTESWSIVASRTNDPPSSEWVGAWNLTTSVTDSDCDGEPIGTVDNTCVTMSVNGNTLSLDTGEEVILGVADGTDAYFFAFSEEEALQAMVSINGSSLGGNLSVHDVMADCDVSATLAGSKRETPCGQGGATGDFAGFWNLTQEVVTNQCELGISDDCIQIIQDGDQVMVVGEDLSAIAEGNMVTFTNQVIVGTTTITAVVSIELSQDGNTLTGTNTLTQVDSENSQNNCQTQTNLTLTRTQGCLQKAPDGILMGIGLGK